MPSRKTEDDLEVEARIRAHLRQQMTERRLDRSGLARIIGVDPGTVTRMLDEERGFGLGLVLRICRGLKLHATHLLEDDPPRRFFDAEQEPRDKHK